jgi:ribonuclease D
VPISTAAVDVTTAAQASALTPRVEAVKELAVDVEADSMHHFRARLCFVQLGFENDIALVDPLAPGVTLAGLERSFADKSVTKIFHAAQGDLTYLAEAGVRVQGLFDTHRAVTLLGWPKVGLADLVLQICGATLKKEHQQADFSVRPLPGELRDYIADDVRYLLDVGHAVREACVTADILEEVLLDCDRLCDEATVRPDPVASFEPKLPRGELKGDLLARAWHIAQALNKLRHGWAEAEDLPTGRMLSNMAVVSIATRPPDNLRALAKAPGVRGQFIRQHGDEVLAVLKDFEAKLKAGALPPMPEKPREHPRKKKREEALVQWRKGVATARKVTPSVVLSNGLVDELSRRGPSTKEELAQVPYFGVRRLERDGEAILTVLREAAA